MLLKQSKILDTLPTSLEPNHIYYVKNGDKFEIFITDSSGNPIMLNTNKVATMIKTTNLNITETSQQLPATAVVDRLSIVIYNKSATTVYIGDSSVTSAKGTPILPGRKEAYDINNGLYGVCAPGETADITINEFS